MITYPSTPCFRTVGLQMVDPTTTFRSQSGKRISRKTEGGYFTFTLTYAPLSLSDIAPVRGAVAKARGQFETFTITLPNLVPNGTQTANTTVSSSEAVGVTSVDITGAGSTNTFKAGDPIKFSNHTKVYMLTDDAAASSGNATLDFVPPLITAVVGSTTTVKHSDVPFTVALANDLQAFSTSVNGYSKYELNVEEVF